MSFPFETIGLLSIIANFFLFATVSVRARTTSSSFVVWRGLSPFNGQGIVALLSGVRTKSNNRKTGDMAQLSIVSDSGLPSHSLSNGADASSCGNCPLRPRLARLAGAAVSCYVFVAQSIDAKWKAFQRGAYADGTSLNVLAESWRDKPIRIGDYGDGAMMPESIIRRLVTIASGWTAYTHQWEHTWALWARRYFMASVASAEERTAAKLRGFRTYRILQDGEVLEPGEILCPNETKPHVTCRRCLACSGTEGRGEVDIAIHVH